jgi:protein FAM98B
VAANVSAPAADDDVSVFAIELREFLGEVGCVYSALRTADGFDSVENRARLLEYLAFELAACRINTVNGTDGSSSGGSDAMDVDQDVSRCTDPTAMMAAISKALDLSPDETASEASLVAAVGRRVNQAVQRAGTDYLQPPLLPKPLAPGQMVRLHEVSAMLTQDYTIRRQMLLKRLDVTIQSFKWSGKAAGKLDAIEAGVNPCARAHPHFPAW